jgi:hypothetical protein
MVFFLKKLKRHGLLGVHKCSNFQKKKKVTEVNRVKLQGRFVVSEKIEGVLVTFAHTSGEVSVIFPKY